MQHCWHIFELVNNVLKNPISTYAWKSKTKNWMIDQSSEVLHAIHNQEVNIAIWERRNISSSTQDESFALIEKNYTLRSTGSSKTISVIDQDTSKEYPSINQSVTELLMMYKDITGIDNFRLLLTTVNSNMCRRLYRCKWYSVIMHSNGPRNIMASWTQCE